MVKELATLDDEDAKGRQGGGEDGRLFPPRVRGCA